MARGKVNRECVVFAVLGLEEESTSFEVVHSAPKVQDCKDWLQANYVEGEVYRIAMFSGGVWGVKTETKTTLKEIC